MKTTDLVWCSDNHCQSSKVIKTLENLYYMSEGKNNIFKTECGYGLYHIPEENRTVVIVAGGAGDGPMWSGMVSEKLADGAIFGERNCAPNAYAMFEMGKLLSREKGVIFLVNNYMGDYLNTDLAIELLENAGICAGAVYSADDMFSARHEARENRGGLHGIGQLCKMARFLASEGRNVSEICMALRLMQKKISSCSVLFREGSFFVGEGFSGEQAYLVMDNCSVEEAVGRTADMLFGDLSKSIVAGEKIDKARVYISLNYNRPVSYVEGNALLQLYREWGVRAGIKICGGSAGCYFDVYPDIWGWCVAFVCCSERELNILTPVCGNGFVL